jgi:predicted nicotinamide N-methyase
MNKYMHAFVLEHTRLRRVPAVPELRLRLADEVTPLWRRVAAELGEREVPPPFWAFAWAGGQAIARYLLDHPEEAAGRRVVDLASGSGLCAIAAMKAGAACALAADIDGFCEAAVALNARANGVRVAFTGRDLLDAGPPEADLILAGDICYERSMAARMLAWLRAAHAHGAHVLIGDPDRAYFPRDGLIRLAGYAIPTSHDLEGAAFRRAGVFTWDPTVPPA